MSLSDLFVLLDEQATTGTSEVFRTAHEDALLVVRISGWIGATIQFETSIDTTWTPVVAKNMDTGESASTTTVEGLYAVPVVPDSQFRLNVTAFDHGAITASIRSTANAGQAAAILIGMSGGGGAFDGVVQQGAQDATAEEWAVTDADTHTALESIESILIDIETAVENHVVSQGARDVTAEAWVVTDSETHDVLASILDNSQFGTTRVIDSGANTALSAIEEFDSTTASNTTAANTKLDTLHTDSTGIGVKLDTIHGDVDGLETLVTATNTKLDSIHADVDGLEGLVTSSNTKLDTVHTDLGTLHGDVDGLEGLATSSNTKLDTLHVDLDTTVTGKLTSILAGVGAPTDSATTGDGSTIAVLKRIRALLGAPVSVSDSAVGAVGDAESTSGSGSVVALLKNLRTRITTLDTDITATNTKLDSIHVDTGTTLHADIGSTNTKLDTVHTDLGTTIHADIGSTNTKLDTLHTDVGTTIHADIGSTNTKVDTSNTALGAPADAEATGNGSIIAILKKIRTYILSGIGATTDSTSYGDGSVIAITKAIRDTTGTTGDAEATGLGHDGSIIAQLKSLYSVFASGLSLAAGVNSIGHVVLDPGSSVVGHVINDASTAVIGHVISDVMAAATSTPTQVASLGNTLGKAIKGGTGNKATSASTADQVVLTYTVTTGKTLYIEAIDWSVRLSTIATTVTAFGTISLETPSGTKVLTWDAAGPGMDNSRGAMIFAEPLPVASTAVVRFVCTPSASTAFTWQANIIGYEK